MQNKFLQNGAGWLKSKGVLVYCTCTLSREENQGVIQKFLQEQSGILLEDVSPFLPETAQGIKSITRVVIRLGLQPTGWMAFSPQGLKK